MASKRSLSRLAFTMKASAGRGGLVLVFCLRETGVAQAAITAQTPAPASTHRLGADRGELIAPVRLVEGAVRDPEPAQSVHALVKLALAGDGADDKVRMRRLCGKEGAPHFDGGVTGLDDLLRNGEVSPDEEINVRRVVLRELHGDAPSGRNLDEFYAECRAR